MASGMPCPTGPRSTASSSDCPHHADLVEACFVQVTNRLKEMLPDLGNEVAIDSTVVRSHCAPHRRRVSDPEASWTVKNTTQAKAGGKEWRHGYKLHMVADANHGLPLAQIITTAKVHDSPMLPVVMGLAQVQHGWFWPGAVMADRGYDAASNHEYLLAQGILPIIQIRRNAKTKNVRMNGALPRDSERWEELYTKRQAIERVFKSMKESRRLEQHCVRGLRQITLHSLMSVLTFQATALVRVLAGQREDMRWMVRRVA